MFKITCRVAVDFVRVNFKKKEDTEIYDIIFEAQKIKEVLMII